MVPEPGGFTFDNSYARDLEGLYVPWQPAVVPAPKLLRLNVELAEELLLDPRLFSGEHGAAVFSGNNLPAGAAPIAQAYAGHQFGGFSPQLGDGRALLIGEVIDKAGSRRDVAFKGSGRTPFSRGGDGKAAVGPVLREYLIGEAMHALGVPTSRALAAASTGESIRRERQLPGAVLTRVASSHIRIGTFEYFASRRDLASLKRLADYAIARHDPHLADHPQRYLQLLAAVSERQAALIAQWMHVGFIHGVMNTDNMTISGETIDYGPCAFMEAYDPQAVFSSIDHGGRYAYANQPTIAQWNLARFAETLLPIVDGVSPDEAVSHATAILLAFPDRYDAHWLAGARVKLGVGGESPEDDLLVRDWLEMLRVARVDFTQAWRSLADAAAGDTQSLAELFPDPSALNLWLPRWRARLQLDRQDARARLLAMKRASPLYIPRNHRVEEALEAAADNDMTLFERLLAAITHPFDARVEHAVYAQPAPAETTARYKTFCGT